MSTAETTTATEAKTARKAKELVPYVVGRWTEDGKFIPCLQQPPEPITQFDEIVRWTLETFGKSPDSYSFVRRDPRTLKIAEQRTIKGTLV
jgi:hypothetical protein